MLTYIFFHFKTLFSAQLSAFSSIFYFILWSMMHFTQWFNSECHGPDCLPSASSFSITGEILRVENVNWKGCGLLLVVNLRLNYRDFAFWRVSDEKDARGYLQALATKMSEELEGLKVSGLAGGAGAVSILLKLTAIKIIRTLVASTQNKNDIYQQLIFKLQRNSFLCTWNFHICVVCVLLTF